MDFAIPAPNDLTHTANEGTKALPHHVTIRHTLDSPPDAPSLISQPSNLDYTVSFRYKLTRKTFLSWMHLSDKKENV